eukprot:scaffold39525_cov191-Amphora_coffeaeformis.AAC.1
MIRKILGCWTKSFVPAPIPISRNEKHGGLPVCGGGPTLHSCSRARNKAAPVGVTNSPVSPGGPAATTKPLRRNNVAGAGTGSNPWAARTVP